jgi:4-diphosphocytidyl-2-C-methyl-D-erythritol kinase
VAEYADLSVRAARALKAATGCSLGVEIHIDKRIPMGAGLGGGSSDAATTLVALNQLWNTGLDTEALATIGLRLGADVPVFVRGHAAWGEGIGEQLTPITLPEPWYLVVTPDAHVDSGDIFRAAELPRSTPKIDRKAFFSGATGNDCERVACARHPVIAETLARLHAFGAARMSGTGSSVFCPFATREDAVQARAQFAGQRSFVARGINHSPLSAVVAAIIAPRQTV